MSVDGIADYNIDYGNVKENKRKRMYNIYHCK